MSMWLSLVSFLTSVAFICTSFEYDGPHGNYSAIAGVSALQNNDEEKYANSCFCYDQWGKIYNLAPLQNTTLTVPGKNDPEQRFSFNPCSPLQDRRPRKGDCKKEDAAICWWTPHGGPDAYRVIGTHSQLTCHVNRKNKYLLYETSGTFHDHPVKVELKCDRDKTEKADFELRDEDEWIFHLTHQCACGDGCPVNPVKCTATASGVQATPNHDDPMKVVIPVAAGAGAVVFILAIFVVRYLYLVQQGNNDGNVEERRRLLENGGGNQRVDENHNPIQESSAGLSRPMPIGSS